MIKNILVIVTLLLVSLGTVAGVDISVIYKLDGIKITNSADIPGSVSYRNGEITITPKSGYYFSLDDPDDLIVIKTIDGSQAQTRTPNINTGLEITAKDATADPSGETKYTFTVPGDEYDYEITANFHKRTSITKNYNISIEKGPGTDGHYIYTGATFEPTVTLALGNTTLTENTDFTVTYADNIDAGTGKITLEGIRKYDGKLTGKGNNGLSALTFVIDKADPTLKFTPGSATITFGKESEFEMPTLKTAPEGITVTYESKDPNTATVHKSTGDITPVAFGKTTITAKYDGDDNWNSASDSYTLTVEKGKAVVKKAPTANSQTYTYTGEPQELIVAGEGMNGEMQYKVGDKGTYSTTIPTGTNADDYTVYYKVVGTSNQFDDSEEGSIIVKIAKAKLTVTAEDNKIVFGDEEPEYSVAYEGFVNKETASVLGGKLAFTCGYKKGSNAGTYPITPSGLTSDNYEITFAKGTLTVEKGDITVTAPKAVDGLVYTGTAQALITAGSADGGEMQYSLDGKTYDKAIPTGTDAKTYTVYYTVVADGNHNAVEAKTVSATIAKARLFVKANDMTITQGAEAPEYTVTYDGFVNDESASVLGGELAFNCEYRQGADAGTYTIMPEGLTSSNYDIVYDKGTLTVEKKEEPAKENNTGIAFTSADVKAVIGEAIALPKLQNPYNLPVEWLSSNIKVATVDQEGMVTIVGPGVAEIWAVFKGNNLFESVSAMYLLTVIQKMDTGIAFPVSEIKAVLGESFQAPELQNPYGLTVEYLSSNPDVATVDQNGVVTLTGAGVAEIWAIFKGNDNYIAAAAIYLLNVLERSDGPGSDDPSDDPPTAINSVTTADDSNDRWYSLNGQKIDKPTKKGVYIRNGEKVVIK